MNEESETQKPKNCFIVMPFGKNREERRWFKGWYEVVIKIAVTIAGYKPILAASEEQPGAINDEIRTHLSFDPMVVVDLGGMEPDEDPNPNVMYELGIRHALGLPLVMMAWEGQTLPFDVSNQRVIMEPRDFLGQETNKNKLIAFIKSAEVGKYYKPMEAVGRYATIEAASASLGEDSIIGALVREVRDLRGTVASVVHYKQYRSPRPSKSTIKKLLRKKPFRKDIYSYYIKSGGDPTLWAQILHDEASNIFVTIADEWGFEDWKSYIKEKIDEQRSHPSATPFNDASMLSEELIENIRHELPEQPWPTGTSKEICTKLNISSNLYKKAVKDLINRGVFKRQINGVLVNDNDAVDVQNKRTE